MLAAADWLAAVKVIRNCSSSEVMLLTDPATGPKPQAEPMQLSVSVTRVPADVIRFSVTGPGLLINELNVPVVAVFPENAAIPVWTTSTVSVRGPEKTPDVEASRVLDERSGSCTMGTPCEFTTIDEKFASPTEKLADPVPLLDVPTKVPLSKTVIVIVSA
jgi:hypothetical protein